MSKSKRFSALANTEHSDLGALLQGMSLAEKLVLGYLVVGAGLSAVHIVDRAMEASRLNKPLPVMVPTLLRDSALTLVAWPYTVFQWAQAGYFPIIAQIQAKAGGKEFKPEEQRVFAARVKTTASTLKPGASRQF